VSNASIIILLLVALFVAALVAQAAFRRSSRGGRYPEGPGAGGPGGVMPPAPQNGYHGGAGGYHGGGGHGDAGGGFTGGHH